MVEDEQLTQTELQDEQIENAILNETKDMAQKTTEKSIDLVKNTADKATRDLRDAAKKAAKEASKKTIKALGKVITSAFAAILPYVLIISIVIAFFAGIAYFLEIETAKDMTDNIYKSMNIVEDEGDIANLVELVADDKGYHLEFVEGFDKKLEEAIKNLNKENKSIDLSNKETLKRFIMAEVKTKFPYLQGEDDGKNKFQGSIVIKRYTPNKNIGDLGEASAKEPITLKYVDENVFQSYINNGDSQALNVYTLDENKNLLTATWSYSSDTGAVMQANSPMDYRSATARYTMPFEYPLFFLIDSDCEDFCTSLAQLAMDSTMEIAIIDNVTDTKTVTTVETTTNETRDIYDVKDGKQIYKNSETSSSTTTSSTEVITESVYTNIQVANVKSWATKKDCEISLNSSTQAGTPVTTHSSSPGINHQLVKETDKKREYLVTGQSIATTITTESYQNSYDVTDSEVEENTDDFVKIYDENKDKLNNNLIPDWLFEIMEENPKTVNMIDLTRYLLFKATGKNYGIENFEDISFGDMVEISSGYSNSDALFYYVSSWEHGALLGYIEDIPGYTYTSDVSKCITEDKKYYICVSDLYANNGTRNFGFGVCHYTGSSWNNIGYYKDEGIDITQYYDIGKKLPVELVDRVKKRILEDKVESVKAQTQGLNLTDKQIYALVDVSYRCGNIGNFVEAYKKYGNTDAFKNNFYAYRDANGTPGDHPFVYDSFIGDRKTYDWKAFHEGTLISGFRTEITIGNDSGIPEAKEGDGYDTVYKTTSGKEYKVYEQWKGSYAYNGYGGTTISSYGCGPSCVAIIASSSNPNITPGTVVSQCQSITNANGPGWINSVIGYLNHYGYNASLKGNANNGAAKNEIISHLKAGNPVILLVHGTVRLLNGGSYSYGSHYITLLGVNEQNQVYVGDPGSYTTDGYTTMDLLTSGVSIENYILVSK